MTLTTTTTTSKRTSVLELALTLLVLLVSPLVSQAEIKALDVVLQPGQVQYYTSYIDGPGALDLSKLTFTTSAALDGADATDTSDDGTGGRGLFQRDDWQRRLDGGFADGTAVDVVAFSLPSSCAGSFMECDLADLGVGTKWIDGRPVFCDRHRLIVNYNTFTGQARFVTISNSGEISKHIKHGDLTFEDSGHYALVVANCDQSGRRVRMNGTVIWKSKNGLLPGNMFGMMQFVIVLTLVYFVIGLWYAICMRINKERGNPIEKWIVLIIVLGFIEMALHSLHFTAWNKEGYQRIRLKCCALIIGSLKQGISRCLAIMIGFGWGGVRDLRGSTMRVIVVFSTVYTAVSAYFQLVIIMIANSGSHTVAYIQRSTYELGASVIVLLTLHGIFIVLMLIALNDTTEHLLNMNQTRLLNRYVQLQRILLVTIVASVVWVMFFFVTSIAYNESGTIWFTKRAAGNEVIYLFGLTGVAILWRPNANSKEYSHLMEQPALGAVDGGGHDLELTGAAGGPSAMAKDIDDEFKALSGRKAGAGRGDSEFL